MLLQRKLILGGKESLVVAEVGSILSTATVTIFLARFGGYTMPSSSYMTQTVLVMTVENSELTVIRNAQPHIVESVNQAFFLVSS